MALLWSDESIDKPTCSQLHLLALAHKLFDILHNTHINRKLIRQSVKGAAKHHANTHSLLPPPHPTNCHELEEEIQHEWEKQQKKSILKDFFRYFEETFLILQFEQAMMSFFRMSAAMASLTLQET